MTLALLLLSTLPTLDEVVIYEANLRAEGATGGFAALTSRLKSIKDLGVNTVWLMPVTPVGKARSAGGLGSPYAVSNYDGINSEFGSPTQFRELVDEAHRLKMAVIVDWVANHTAWDHPWVKQHPDWYTKSADGKISTPAGTNWQDVADLDFEAKPMRKAMIASMQRWVTKFGIDGFRCDTADWVPTDFWKEAISSLRKNSTRRLLMLAEGSKPEQYRAGFDITYGWPVYHRLKEVYAGAKAQQFTVGIAQETKDAPPNARWLRFTSNHDESAWQTTTLELYKTPLGVDAAFAVTALSQNATPLVYSGQEVGWQKRVPIFDRSSIDWNQGKASRQWIKKLLALRASSKAVRSGATLNFSNDDAIGYVRSAQKEHVLVVSNCRDRRVAITRPKGFGSKWTEFGSNGKIQLPATIELAPFECRIFTAK